MVRFEIKQDNINIAYGYDEFTGLFLSIFDKRLEWSENNTNEVNDICNRIFSDGGGCYLSLYTSEIGIGYKVSVKTIISFMEKYNINLENFLKDKKINKMNYILDEIDKISNNNISKKSVEILKDAVYMDLLTFNKNVNIHYGFINCKSLDDYINLFGLYQGLIKIIGCDVFELHNSQINNDLSNFIINSFDKTMSTYKGKYYEWFIKNKNIVYKRKHKNLKKEEKKINSLCILYKTLIKYELLNDYCNYH